MQTGKLLTRPVFLVALVGLSFAASVAHAEAAPMRRVGVAPHAGVMRRMKLISVTDLRSVSLLGAKPIRDTLIAPRKLQALRRVQLFSSGGVYYTPDGYAVHVNVSSSYVPDPVADQALVNFLGVLAHGSEMGLLTVDVGTLPEVQALCGPTAASCYAPGANTMVLVGEDQPGQPVAAIAAHEYGHHVAANRSNAPWQADQTGTKRWASYEDVCAATVQGLMFPGDEGAHYAQNPGEGFAEAFRVWNQSRLGFPSEPWGVDSYFYPDANAGAWMQADVASPWLGATVSSLRGRLRARGVRRYTLSPLDGVMSASVSARHGAVVSLSYKGRVFAGPARRVSTTVCGDVPLTITVRARGAGPFALSVAAP
jgi:hypothetical protein